MTPISSYGKFTSRVLRSLLCTAALAGQFIAAQPFSSSLEPTEAETLQVEAPAARRSTRTPVQPGPALRPPDTAWVEATLASMTLDEKIGQMLMPGYSSNTAASYVSNYHVSGFIFQGNSNTAPAVLNATNSLQAITSVPLIFSTDCEAGLGARFSDSTRFPLNMGAAAAYDLDLVREQGRVTARECRAIGIHIGFGPVLDVNTEPINPIIGVRSYSDNPSSVTALARAYVEGANSEGLLCTYKHFPGHGASKGDSHDQLPVINISLPDLMSQHVSPYTQLIAEHTGDLVMTAHIWFPVLDPGTSAWPATLSSAALTGILRNQLNYTGCVITDSMGMAGVLAAANTYDAVKLAVLAGVDILLTPANISDAFNGLKDRVVSQEIPLSRIDDAVRRILTLKSRAGMPETTTMPLSGLATIAHPDNLSTAEALARKAITVNEEGTVLPVLPNETLGVYVISNSSTIFYSYNSGYFLSALDALHSNVSVTTVTSSASGTTINTMVTQAQGFDKVLVVSLHWSPVYTYSSHKSFLDKLIVSGKDFAYISFGSPYFWNQYPEVDTFLCGYSSHYATQQEMARVIVGQSQAHHNWPVQLDEMVSSVNDWSLY